MRGGRPSAGISDSWREAVNKGIVLPQVTGAGRRRDPAILRRREQHLHLLRELCGLENGKELNWLSLWQRGEKKNNPRTINQSTSRVCDKSINIPKLLKHSCGAVPCLASQVRSFLNSKIVFHSSLYYPCATSSSEHTSCFMSCLHPHSCQLRGENKLTPIKLNRKPPATPQQKKNILLYTAALACH